MVTLDKKDVHWQSFICPRYIAVQSKLCPDLGVEDDVGSQVGFLTGHRDLVSKLHPWHGQYGTSIRARQSKHIFFIMLQETEAYWKTSSKSSWHHPLKVCSTPQTYNLQCHTSCIGWNKIYLALSQLIGINKSCLLINPLARYINSCTVWLKYFCW